ncbi:MAG: OmpA family protein [Lewinella sp.]|nr:OmpA family protein [Lewinella sp.]
MLRILVSLMVVSLLAITSLQAQSQGAPDAFAFRYITNNHQWPLDNGGGFDVEDFKVGGLEFEYFRYLSDYFDLSFPLRFTAAQHPQDALGATTRQSFNIGLDALLNFNLYKGEVFRPRLFAGLGGLMFGTDELSLDVPMGLGLNFYLGNNTSLSTTFAYHFSNIDWRDHFKLGIGFRIGIEDYTPPEPVVLDRDGDGILDTEDLCPDTPGIAALNGCPDRDGDGITDASDKCPDTPGIAQFEGCPDTDGDGIADASDKCPDTPGIAQFEGCPDTDGDGIADAQDNCPNDPGPASNQGCPEQSLIVTAKDKITGEVLPNTEVSLVNSSGQVVRTGTTNAMGVVEFANVAPADYTVRGSLYEMALEPAQVRASAFSSAEPVQATVLYDDPNFIVQGKVFYCNSPNPLPSVTLNLKNNADNFMKTTISDATGAFIFHLSQRATYQLYAKKESFLSQVVDVDANEYDRTKSVFVKLEVCAEEVRCGEAVRLNNILYDLGSAAIRADAMPDLNKVVQFLNDNPDATIELSSHTDSRGSASSNLSLSQRRAQSAADYIVAQGIAAERVVGKGYGETQLLNNCADGVRCSEADHQVNRRTEFKVICPD